VPLQGDGATDPAWEQIVERAIAGGKVLLDLWRGMEVKVFAQQ
jgi:hypothetical protein